MKSQYIFDELDGLSPKDVTTFAHLISKGDIVKFDHRFYEIEHCYYAPELNEATYWLMPGSDFHPTAPEN